METNTAKIITVVKSFIAQTPFEGLFQVSAEESD